jgi:outer membrane protein assembly factor BamC
MKVSRLAALFITTLTLAGCGSMSLENKRVDYQAAAIKVPSLEVPPDLTSPAAEDHFTIPEGSVAVANYSDFSKGGGVPQARGGASVLPESKYVRVERNGSQRWLEVDDKPENVWPTIKAFWVENGFVIKTDDPQAGIIETDWAENRAKIPMDALRKVIGKVLDGLYDSGERDMYHVRLERSKEGNKTEIYLTQYGKQQELTADKTTTQWLPRPNDPELEATMLQMLMVKLGGPDMQGKVQSEAVAATDTNVAAKLQTQANGNKVILISEPFDRSWRSVGLALEHAGFVLEDKNRANGVYFVSVEEKSNAGKDNRTLIDKLTALWHKDESTKPSRYEVTVHENSAGCEVAANNGKGDSNATSQRIIDALFKALSK